MTRWTHGLVNRLVIASDMVMIAVSAVISYAIWHTLSWSQMLVLFIIGAFSFAGMLSLGQAYRVEHYERARRQIGHILIGGFPAALAVFVVYYALVPSTDDDFSALAVWAGVTTVALLIERLVFVRIGMAWVRRNALLQRNVVLLGDIDRAYDLVRRSREAHEGNNLLSFVGIFRDEGRVPAADEPPRLDLPPLLGGTADLLEYAKDQPVDIVIVVKSWDDPRAIAEVATKLNRVATDVMIEMEPDGFMLDYARVTSLAGRPALQIQQRPLKGSLGLLKALEDYVVAGIGVLITAPVLLLAAIAIKLDSPGPVLFRQPRVGLNNAPFMVFKLRTMHYNPTDDGSVSAVKQDPRVTRVGKLLRSFSIDELPQLFNVLKGEMSVVGPRPHVPNMIIAGNVRYEAISDYVARYRMKPGITGWAQINGMRGGIHTVEKAERGVELDLYYIEHWSIWFDIRIILLTVTKGMADTSAF